MPNPALTWFVNDRDGWRVDFVGDHKSARQRTADGVMVVGVKRRRRYSTLSADLMLTNHNFTPVTKGRLRELVSPLRKEHPRVRSVVSAMTFRLCVPNEEVKQVKESLMALLSENAAYEWCQRPLAALRRGLVRDTEQQDETERRKLYPLQGLFG